MAGFKDHPLYVLARHLKREEVVDPPVELGKFRGEPVYPRANVLQLKTAENWMRQGRTVIVGAQPLKWVKQRAVTVNKKRAIEVALADRRERTASASGSARASASASVNGQGEEGKEDFGDAGLGRDDGLAVAGEGFAAEDGVMQGLYAEHQTELYRPPPIVDVSVFDVCRLFGWLTLADVTFRAKCQRTTSGTSTYMFRRCFQPVLHTFLVRAVWLWARLCTADSDIRFVFSAQTKEPRR